MVRRKILGTYVRFKISTPLRPIYVFFFRDCLFPPSCLVLCCIAGATAGRSQAVAHTQDAPRLSVCGLAHSCHPYWTASRCSRSAVRNGCTQPRAPCPSRSTPASAGARQVFVLDHISPTLPRLSMPVSMSDSMLPSPISDMQKAPRTGRALVSPF